jgi:hypothetical protein
MLWVNSHQACTHDRAATSHVLQLRRSMLCRRLPFRNMQLRHRIVPQAVSSNSARLTSAQWDFSQSISPTHNSRRNSIAECRPLQPEISPTVNSADGLDSFISSAIGFNNGDSSRRSCASTTSIAHDSQRRAGRLCCDITSLPPGLNGTFGSDSSERDNRSPATHVLDAAPLSRPAEVILNGNPSVEDLASALARLPRRVSSATVLEGATVSVAQMSRCALVLYLAATLVGAPTGWSQVGIRIFRLQQRNTWRLYLRPNAIVPPGRQTSHVKHNGVT